MAATAKSGRVKRFRGGKLVNSHATKVQRFQGPKPKAGWAPLP